MPSEHPIFARLRASAMARPLVVAHRGASRLQAENTLAAFRAARDLGVVMQEFDVQPTRDGVLVCMHDETLDRTTDAARTLGPGALVAQATSRELVRLDASSWHPRGQRGETVPTLAQALAVMLPRCIPLIEHKAGAAGAFLDALHAAGALDDCIVQSFDWRFVASIHAAAPRVAVALLGPTPEHPRIEEHTVAAASAMGAGMLHWHDRELGRDQVRRIQDAGMLVCTYTTDEELGWAGGRALGIDAMCTNVPESALTW